MSKVYIIHENNLWLEPVAKVLNERGIPYESLFMDGGSIDLPEKPAPGVYFNRMSESSYTRNHPHAPDYTAALLAWLEAHDAHVINPLPVVRLEVSKVEQYAKLQKAGFNVPKTVACFGKGDILKKAQKFKPPFILKPNRGGKGIGIQLIQSHQILADYLNHEDYTGSVDDIMLIQEYIAAPDSTITRMEFIDSKFVYAVRVDTTQGFELCPAEACRTDAPAKANERCAIDADEGLFRIFEKFDDPIAPNIGGFLAENKISVAGVEFVRDRNSVIYIYDINTNTNYNPEAEKKAGKFAIPILADYLQSELRKSGENTAGKTDRRVA